MRWLALLGHPPGEAGPATQRMLAAARESAEPEAVVALLDEALALLRRRDPGSDPAPVVLLGPALESPARSARELATVDAELRFVFVCVPEDEAALTRELTYAAPPGHRWAVARADSPQLARQLREALDVQQQHRKLRTTLARINESMARPVQVHDLEYRRLVASDHYLAAVLKHVQDAIVSVDRHGRVRSWNLAAARILGVDEAAAVGRLLKEVGDGGVFDRLHDDIAGVLEGRTVNRTLDLREQPSGRFLEVSLSPLLDDARQVTSVVLILRDLTERQNAREQLLEANRRKDEFLAMLGHELRNPLAPVRSAAAILRLVADQPDRVRQTSDVIQRQVDHMVRLVDDLLDASRVTRGLVYLDLEPLDLGRVVQDAVAQMRPQFEAKGVPLQLRGPAAPAAVLGDHVRLVQVLANLLSNAVKFTPAGGGVDVAWGAYDDGQVELRVADDGAGIEASFLPHVFEMFTQGKPQGGASVGGLGVGLALVKTLVEMHGGRVVAHSPGRGRGATFTIRLPALTGHDGAAAPAQPAAAAPAGRRRRIIVVDDNRDAAETVGMLLGSVGHEVSVLYGPEEVVAKAQSERPEVMFIDIGMPGIDGYELARRLRALPGGGSLRLVALSGYGRQEDRQSSLAAGFDAHLTKPAAAELLLRWAAMDEPAP